jgi:hypothetical protein
LQQLQANISNPAIPIPRDAAGNPLNQNGWLLLLINQNLRTAWGATPGLPLAGNLPSATLLDIGEVPDPTQSFMGTGRLGANGTFGTIFNNPITSNIPFGGAGACP